ncbi:DUF397 domain-containing protein [Spirillospora sp. NPDC050679]
MNHPIPQWRKSSHSSGEGGDCVEVAALWRKSSHSNPQGGECVEVAALWRKSSRSSTEGGSCVEVAALAPEIGLRDSKDPDGPHLHIAPDAFAAFLARVKGVSPA